MLGRCGVEIGVRQPCFPAIIVLRLPRAAPSPRVTDIKAAMQGKSDSKSKGATSLTTEAITHRIAWARHIIALIAGLACGVIGITGFIGIIVFVASNILLVLGYYMYILGVDPEEHGGHGQFTNEALMPALAVFVVRPVVHARLTHPSVVLDRLLQHPAERPGVLRIGHHCQSQVLMASLAQGPLACATPASSR